MYTSFTICIPEIRVVFGFDLINATSPPLFHPESQSYLRPRIISDHLLIDSILGPRVFRQRARHAYAAFPPFEARSVPLAPSRAELYALSS
jgi:hypothetical protein